jgi:hypothetical protein
MVIDGLRRSESAKLQEYAYEIALKWIRTNYYMYKQSGSMFEKYDALELGKGSGGEYETPVGFGWTNGVVLDLLVTYGARLNSLEFSSLPSPSANKTGWWISENKTRSDTVIEVDHYYHYESFSISCLPSALIICILLLFHSVFY